MNLASLLTGAHKQHLFPGVAVAVVKGQSEPQLFCSGHHTYLESSPIVTPDTIFDVASVTKTMPTSTLALLLWQQGKLDFKRPVQDFFPNIAPGYSLTVEHLLQQTVAWDIPPLSSLKQETATQIKERLITAPLRQPPGTSYQYSNASSIILGWILEIITDTPLSQLAQVLVWEPLGMSQTFWGEVPVSLYPQTAPTEQDAWRNTLLHAEVHDESAWILQKEYGPVGSAGVFSTITDVSRYLQALLQTPSPLIDQYIRKQWQTYRALPTGEAVTWGWEWRPFWMGEATSSKAIGKTGFTGCSIAIDWKKHMAIAMLSNAVHPQRPPDREVLNAFRRQLHTLILQDAHISPLP